MKRQSAGFTLIELMVAMSLGLVLISALMAIWVELSKNSHKEIVKLEFSQDRLEVVSYLRSMLGKVTFEPYCMHPEWLMYKETDQNNGLVELITRKKRIEIHSSSLESEALPAMVDVKAQYPDLNIGRYQLRTLAGSDLIDLVYLTPLNIVDNEIKNSDEVRGNRSGDILATDCRVYVAGQYVATSNGRYSLSQSLQFDVAKHLNIAKDIQYYKINRALIYVSYERDAYHLVINTMDGSNHVRFSNIQSIRVRHLIQQDPQLLHLRLYFHLASSDAVVAKDFYIRMLGL